MHFLDCKQFALHEDLNRGLTWLYTSINNLNKNIEALQTARHNCEDSFVFREDYMLTQSSKSHTADNTPVNTLFEDSLCKLWSSKHPKSFMRHHIFMLFFVCGHAKAVKKDSFLF